MPDPKKESPREFSLTLDPSLGPKDEPQTPPPKFDLSNLPDDKPKPVPQEEQTPTFDLSNLPDDKKTVTEEKPNFLSRAYHWWADPLTTIPSDVARTMGQAATDPNTIKAGTPFYHSVMSAMGIPEALTPTPEHMAGFGAGAMQGLGDLASQATSPYSLATMLLSGGSGYAARKGLPAIAQAMKYAGAASGAPIAAHGAYGVGNWTVNKDVPTSELMNSLAELGAGVGSMAGATKFGAKTPKGEVTLAEDLQRPVPEPIKAPGEVPPEQIKPVVPQEEKEGPVGASDIAPTLPVGPGLGQTGDTDAPDMSDFGGELAGIASRHPIIYMKTPTTSDIMKLVKRGYRADGTIDPNRGVRFTLGSSKIATAQQTPGGISGSAKENPIAATPIGNEKGVINIKGPSPETIQSMVKKDYYFNGTTNPDGSLQFEYRATAPGPPTSSSRLASVDKGVAEVQGFVKSVMASNDLSAFRQAYPSMTYKAYWTSIDDMVKAWHSQAFYDEGMKAIRSDPLYEVKMGPNGRFEPSTAEKMGLDITDSIRKREELYSSAFADKYVPGVKRSERAYTLFLNKLRTDNYKSLLIGSGAMNKDGIIVDEPLAREFAEFVNDATGRGDLGALEKHAKLLNQMFFSPKLLASRVNIMAKPLTYMNMPWAVRKQYLRSLLGVAGVGSTVSELFAQVGNMVSPGSVQVSHNPTNPDFMKIKVGNTRVDPLFGFQQPVVLAARLLLGQTTSSTSGKTRNLYTVGGTNLGTLMGRQAVTQKSPYDPTALSTVMNYGRSKLDPTLGFAVSLLDAATEPGGQKMQFGLDASNGVKPFFDSLANNAIAQRFIPMVMQDIYAIANDEPGLLPGILMGAGTVVGAGTQTYGGRPNVPGGGR